MPGAKWELFLIKTKGEKVSRKEKFLSDLRAELTDSEIVAGLGNGDIALPEWLAMSEGVDHVKLADFDGGDSFQVGLTTIWYTRDDE